MTTKKKLSHDRFAAMVAARADGKALAVEHPEVADKWRSGLNYMEVAHQCLPHLSRRKGSTIVGYAMEALVPKEEIRSVNSSRKSEHSRMGGAATSKKGVGFFQVSGPKKEFALKKAGRNATLLRGQVPYDDVPRPTEFGVITEKEYIKRLIALREDIPRYTWRMITLHVNAIFGNNRARRSIIAVAHHKIMKVSA